MYSGDLRKVGGLMVNTLPESTYATCNIGNFKAFPPNAPLFLLKTFSLFRYRYKSLEQFPDNVH